MDGMSYIRDTNQVLDLHEKVLLKFLYVQAIEELIKIDFKKGRCFGDCGTRCNLKKVNTDFHQDTDKVMSLKMGEVKSFGLLKCRRTPRRVRMVEFNKVMVN